MAILPPRPLPLPLAAWRENGEVTLGGRRVPVSRPRARTADGDREIELETYEHFAARDQLADVMLERMLAGVSTRRYARTGEPVGSDIDDIARSTSKSAISREFVSKTRENLLDLMARPLSDLRLAVVMLDGIELKGVSARLGGESAAALSA